MSEPQLKFYQAVPPCILLGVILHVVIPREGEPRAAEPTPYKFNPPHLVKDSHSSTQLKVLLMIYDGNTLEAI